MEPIQVYCRIRPPVRSDAVCVNATSSTHLQVTQPSAVSRNGQVKSVEYAFKRVFDQNSSQKDVFDIVALKLVENLLIGKNGLLLTYGVTSSGKTFTMTGTAEQPGIMPRCLDVIFNSIYEFQAKKFVFKSDKLNGFEIQSDEDAKLERDRALSSHISQKTNKRKINGGNSDPDLLGRARDTERVGGFNENNTYAVFVTFTEVYNNTVYDLLEDLYTDSSKPKPLQAKIVREDCTHCMYIHGVTEVEISSPEEAFEVFYKGQKRKHIAQTTLNTESSRAHTIFNIRVVQALTDQNGETVVTDKKEIVIGQLTLVDLAGSERSVRTKNLGVRLREAGSINNSLLTLRTCLEILKENQNGGNKIIPYRESRLTHLFKSYFEGRGQISMIICVSPIVEDFEETLHVLKFGEMSQEVYTTCASIAPIKHSPYPSAVPINTYTPGRRKANQAFKEKLVDLNIKGSTESLESISEGKKLVETKAIVEKEDIPDCRIPLDRFFNFSAPGFVSPNDETVLSAALNYLKEEEYFSPVLCNLRNRYNNFRALLLKQERRAFVAIQEEKSLKSLHELEKNKVAELEGRLQNLMHEMNMTKRKYDDSELNYKRLKRELSERNLEVNEIRMENENLADMYTNQIKEVKQKLNEEYQVKLSAQKSALGVQLKKKKLQLRKVRHLLESDSDSLTSITMAVSKEPDGSSKAMTHLYSNPSCSNIGSANQSSRQQYLTPPVRKLGRAVANKRHRRSRSADVWLDHRPALAVPLGTVLQPKMANKKSITKLTQAKDVTDGASKYCLMTQSQDQDGDLETRLYKGDVIPTAGGGAQVMFNDVEVLKQMSPSCSPQHKSAD